ncbi:SseB family protein [Verrucomicrobium spinosum]|uniref:SseB family protein n=1 Tax=Verrucomicrobium spinosum TaxID=2736 RepID=UPI0009461CF6|nr:SseB family protein [Verrucomicrobium spinosum]
MATPSDSATDSRFRGEAPENAIETAHALYRSELSNTSFSEVLLSWTSHFVFALVPEDVGMEEALTTEGPDGHTFIAVFTSLSRAAATVASAGLPHRPLAVSIFEVIFLAEPNFGLVINPTIPVWEWTFLSGELERLRTLLLTPLPLFERGSICAIRAQNIIKLPRFSWWMTMGCTSASILIVGPAHQRGLTFPP